MTNSGSTQQHGPRFKRRRDGNAPPAAAQAHYKENAIDEDLLMVEDEEPVIEELELEDAFENVTDAIEDIYAAEAGKGISHGGATKPVMGKKISKQWIDILVSKGKLGM